MQVPWPQAGLPADSAVTGMFIDPREVAHGGETPGAWGYIQQGNLETVAVIFSNNANPFEREYKEYLTTPYTAVVSGYDRKNRNGETTEAHEALFNMIMERNFPMPKFLTECKSYLFSPGYMTRALLEAGLDPNLPDWQRWTPLHDMAARRESSEEALKVAEMLLEFGADLNAVDEADRTTTLGVAAYSGNEAMVDFPLKHGADAEISGEAWSRPFVRAERRGHGSIVEKIRIHTAKQE